MPCATNQDHPAQVRASGFVIAVLNEILANLRKLSVGAEPGSIDLRRPPATAADREQLRVLLGPGEVATRIDALGQSEFNETSFAGIWWVVHKNTEGTLSARRSRSRFVPEMLAASCPVVRAAADEFAVRLVDRQ